MRYNSYLDVVSGAAGGPLVELLHGNYSRPAYPAQPIRHMDYSIGHISRKALNRRCNFTLCF